MGNCLHAPKAKNHHHQFILQDGGVEAIREAQEQQEVPAAEAAGMKVKVVLTRGELEWLMAQLKTGEKRLEDVLHQMGRDKQHHPQAPPSQRGWRPSLHSIVEAHEPPAATFASSDQQVP